MFVVPSWNNSTSDEERVMMIRQGGYTRYKPRDLRWLETGEARMFRKQKPSDGRLPVSGHYGGKTTMQSGNCLTRPMDNANLSWRFYNRKIWLSMRWKQGDELLKGKIFRFPKLNIS